MKTGFSLWELTYREFPVSLTGFGFAVHASLHNCILDFPFFYQFYSKITILFESTFKNPMKLFIFKSFCFVRCVI